MLKKQPCHVVTKIHENIFKNVNTYGALKNASKLNI